ncbi:MAG: patatin-like phospholipase RssA [Leptospiraceae bacterium]|nr:patatin-like phospholipase RssA [Leptospiraceae bacterium]
MKKKRIVGLALGSGSARGWSHIGVIKALESYGIRPDIVCGTSVGALVGSFYAGGKLPDLEAWLLKLKWRDVISFLDMSLGSGLIKGKKLFEYFEEQFSDTLIENLNLPFGAVATEIDTGMEIWIRTGSVLEAVRASISLPGVFTPVKRGDMWLIDGATVNPVPISLCRAMGAEIVIAVDLNLDLMDRRNKEEQPTSEEIPVLEETRTWEKAKKSITSKFWGKDLRKQLVKEKDEKPSLIEVVSKAISIMQVRITRSRMAGDPPEILISPRLGYLGMMEYHRAAECIEEGKKAVERAEIELKLYF